MGFAGTESVIQGVTIAEKRVKGRLSHGAILPDHGQYANFIGNAATQNNGCSSLTSAFVRL
jgi:hypothetical protein